MKTQITMLDNKVLEMIVGGAPTTTVVTFETKNIPFDFHTANGNACFGLRDTAAVNSKGISDVDCPDQP